MFLAGNLPTMLRFTRADAIGAFLTKANGLRKILKSKKIDLFVDID